MFLGYFNKERKKRRHRSFSVIFILFFSFICLYNVDAANNVKLQGWHLVDSGKHLDWTGKTKYSKRFNKAVEEWNNYKPRVIRKDTAFTIADVLISDYYLQTEVAGVTTDTGHIKFNKFHMDSFSLRKRRNTCTHELGHALGLAHNVKKSIMYEINTDMVHLRAADKASYDAAYKRY